MQEIVIEAGRAERQYWQDLWRYRELFYFLAWRDILIRYKQTIVGAAWAILRPLLTMIVLTVVFGRLAKVPSPAGVPYPVLVFCGVLPWQFFSTAVSDAGQSLVLNSSLISKVYFPRMTVPASSVMTSLVDLLISGSLLAVLMLWYGFVPSASVVLLPLVIVLAFAAAFGAGVWIAALMVKYRDFRFVVPFVVQFGLYVSPVGFTTDIVPPQWRLIYSLNPMVGVIDAFRRVIIGPQAPVYWPGFVISVAVMSVLLVSGIWYFRQTERTFADVI